MGLVLREDGVKGDAEKPRYDLIPFNALDDVAAVLTYGAAKYAPDNWRRIREGERRYLAAGLRHVSAYARGELMDQESGRPHLAHAICCFMYILEGFADE